MENAVIVMFCAFFKILKISFVCANRVKHAVAENTEVFQGESLGKTPDG